MTLAQIEYALALQHYKSFKLAARSLGISQPGLSLQIQKLEAELNIQLFNRTTKTIFITDKGRKILDRAQLLINEASQIKDLATRLSEEFTGELRIGIIPTLAPYLLPFFMDGFAKQHNNLTIRIKESLTEEILADLKAGALDGGIIATPISSAIEFEYIPLLYEGFKLFVSPNHPLFVQNEINISDIPKEDIWLLKEGNCFRDQVNHICNLSKPSEVKHPFHYESSSIESLCRIVEYKGGITFLPELTSIHLDADREELIKPIAGTKHVREISMLYLPNHIKYDDLHAFADSIKQNVPKNLLSRGRSDRIPTKINV